MKGLLPIYAYLFILSLPITSSASHNRAGHIYFKRLYGLTYKITITAYTDGCYNCADRPRLPASFESCTREDDDNSIARKNGPDTDGDSFPDGEILSGFSSGEIIQLNIYDTVYTYPGPGVYVISVKDPNRNADVVNMTNSLSTPFYIETIFYIESSNFINNSPIVTIPPVYNACLNKIFIYNPGAIDTSDADSLSYKLDSCYQNCDSLAMGYSIPGSVTVNAFTGDFIWNMPTVMGRFNFAMCIYEWRDGVIISKIHLDMQIIVQPCPNDPPEISANDEYCILAGDSLVFDVTATDPDGDAVFLSATGDPFYASPPAAFDSDTAPSPNSSAFRWDVECTNIRQSPYLVYFKAEDIDSFKLIDIHTVRITVISPPPLGLGAVPAGNSIYLNWTPGPCTQVTGYNIYRSDANDTTPIFCPCQYGIPAGSGYVLIGSTSGYNAASFTDDDGGNGLIHGIQYCYRVTAMYADGSESCASAPACASLKRDVPIITNVDVVTTDSSNGTINIRWAQPIELDTDLIQGPYKYLIYRSPDMNGNSLTLIDSLSSLADTSYFDSGLNTAGVQYSYRIEFYNDGPGNRFRIGFTQKASSVFLSIAPGDNTLALTWDEKVPWINYKYEVYKFNKNSSQYLYLTSVAGKTFTDTGLVNGREYCYYVRSVGEYSTPGICDTIFNRSQQVCESPRDLTPPCPPSLSYVADCPASRVYLSWTNPNHDCSDDVVAYAVYRAPQAGDIFELVALIANSSDTFYTYVNPLSLAGCYTVTAIDSFDNESIFAAPFCIDNCPVYSLPNVFTPDGNGINDRFMPFPYLYIENVNIKIFNRWGQLVFESTDPDIMWDGKHQKTNKDCTAGVYYYLCEVTEKRLYGPQSYVITGYIELLRDATPKQNY